MNNLDKQFGQLMKGVKIDSPSKDFSLKVMERIQAEAALRKHAVVKVYQPVISRKTWIILIAAFILLTVYILVFGSETAVIKEPELLSTLTDSLKKIDTKGVSTLWQSASGLFSTIPPMAYLILLSSMALWTLDSFLTRFRHRTSHVQVN